MQRCAPERSLTWTLHACNRCRNGGRTETRAPKIHNTKQNPKAPHKLSHGLRGTDSRNADCRGPHTHAHMHPHPYPSSKRTGLRTHGGGGVGVQRYGASKSNCKLRPTTGIILATLARPHNPYSPQTHHPPTITTMQNTNVPNRHALEGASESQEAPIGVDLLGLCQAAVESAGDALGAARVTG